MKYYAVRKGNKVGIFTNWEECKESINGFKGAQYQSFKTEEEANNYLSEKEENELIEEEKCIKSIESLEDDEMIIYSDGSYNDNLKLSSYGIVYLQKGKELIMSSGIVEDLNNTRNVIGEITGVLKALEFAKSQNKKKVYVYHDYEGLSKWINKEWSVSNPDSAKYYNKVNEFKESLDIEFGKVKAHSGEEYNDICDKLAKNELKSLQPSKSDEWGFRSYRYTDLQIDRVMKKMQSEIDNFNFVAEDKGNCVLYKCFLGKEKLTFKKFKFDSTNSLVIPMGKSQNLYSIVISYLGEFNSTASMLLSLNANYNTTCSKEIIEKRLYTISPSLEGKQVNVTIYKLLLQATYNLFLNVDNFEDCGFLTTPALRSLEGHLKQVFRNELGIEVGKNFGYFDKDSSTGLHSLQQTYVNRLDRNCVDYINECYNVYSTIRHKLLHFGDLDIDDTKVISKEEAIQIINKIITLVGKYYK